MILDLFVSIYSVHPVYPVLKMLSITVHCCLLTRWRTHLLYCRLQLHLQDVLRSTLAHQVQPLQFAMLTGSQEAGNMHVVQASKVLTLS
jgi:hypothetical protein